MPWPPGLASAASPVPGVPPTGQDLAAASDAVTQRAAAAGAAANRVAAAQARLVRLRARAEALIERYDGAVVALHAATSAVADAQARLAGAVRAQAARQDAVGELASAAYRTDGGFGSMSAVIGGPGGSAGPQAFFDRVGLLGVLAEHDADVLAASRASSLVAQVFRGQAAAALAARQAAAGQAAALKSAAVARQQRVLTQTRATRSRLVRQLAAARAREGALARELAGPQPGDGGGGDGAGAGGAGSGGGGASAGAPGWAYASGAGPAAGGIAAKWALGQLGKPYVWAAAGPGSFDCSGLTMRAWQRAGVQLDHWTGTQWTSGPHIPLGQLRRGDLVFFADNTADPRTIHHVGIYIGRDLMVDAPYTGVDVRIDSICEPGLIGATRPAA